MTSNFPVEAATDTRPILGFRLFRDAATHEHLPIRGPASLATAVVVSGIRARYGLPVVPARSTAVLSVPVDGDIDFQVDSAEAAAVFDRGYEAVAEQLPTRLAEIIAVSGAP